MRWSVSQKGARVVLALMIAVCCCLAWAPVAWGQSSSTTSTSSQATSAEADDGSADGRAMLILDASSSMLAADAGGTRMDSAKKAANELVDSLPDTANMGLMVYGANESDAPDNRERGCKDVETLATVGWIDRGKFASAINGLEPKGYTPMGHSLRKAAEELGSEGQRSIILVSDGIDSCAPPPVCEVAKELAQDGVDLAIHTVGFQVDEEARKELQCIADAGNGQFLEAGDAGSLAQSLKFLAQRDIGKYKVKGTPFEFADSPGDAKWFGEGQYRTKVTPDTNAKKNRYFRVSVPEGHNALITMTPIWQTEGNIQETEIFLEVPEATNENDPDCGTASNAIGDSRILGEASLLMNPYRFSLERGGSDNDCDMSSWLIATQVYQEGQPIDDALDLEVNVFYVPNPDQEQKTEWSNGPIAPSFYDGDVPFGTPQENKGGTGFNDAIEITEGTYSDKIVPGEYRFYKIPVKWGQRPVVKMKTPESVTEDADVIKVGIYDSQRKLSGEGSLNVYDDAKESDPIAPKYYAQVANDIGKSYQGYYYLNFAMNSKLEDGIAGVEQPYEFAVIVDGQPFNGGPDWTPTYEDGPEPSDEPIKFDGAMSTDEQQTVEETTEAAEETEQVLAEEEAGGLSLPLLGGLGVLLLAVIGAVVFMFSRNRAQETR